MEQRDVPARAHQAQEFEQGTGTLGEFKAQQAFVLRQRRVPAHHVPDVLFGQFVVRQVNRLELVLVELGGDLAAFALAVCAQAQKDVGFVRVAHAVVELGHVARAARQAANQLQKALEAAALFRNGDREQGFFFFAHVSALGHKAQAVKVHVGAAQDSRKGLALAFVRGHVLLDGRHGQRTCGFDDGAGVYKHVLDGGAHRVGVHRHVGVHQVAGHAEGFFAHQLDGRAVREQAHIGQSHALLRGHRLDHGIRVVHLHANHLDTGAHRLDVIGYAADQATAANGHKHRIQRPLVLAQHFHGNGALARDHVRVVKGVHKREALLFLKRHRVVVGI